eukprot:COSAG01_NODE_179_length_22923_cov_25.190535_18_plen_151_part_00
MQVSDSVRIAWVAGAAVAAILEGTPDSLVVEVAPQPPARDADCVIGAPTTMPLHAVLHQRWSGRVRRHVVSSGPDGATDNNDDDDAELVDEDAEEASSLRGSTVGKKKAPTKRKAAPKGKGGATKKAATASKGKNKRSAAKKPPAKRKKA